MSLAVLDVAELGAVFLAGLAGSAHCAAMCGPIALTLRQDQVVKVSRVAPRRAWVYNQGGRIIGYGLAGALAGSIGLATTFSSTWLPVQVTMMVLFNVFLLVLGLQMLGIVQRWKRLEAVAANLWKRLQPILRHFWPPVSAAQHLLFGLSWGMMPCGLVYSVLPLAMLTASVWRGSAIMLVFGLGTLPIMGLVGHGQAWLPARWRGIAWRRFAALLVTIVAGLGLARAIVIAGDPSAWLVRALAWCA